MTAAFFQLGKCVIRLSTEHPQLLDTLRPLLPLAVPQPAIPTADAGGHLLEFDLDRLMGAYRTFLDEEFDATFRYIVDRAVDSHAGSIWLDASSLITADGKKVLLAGPSFSGKTTLTLALTAAHGWKVVCEDITLLDTRFANLVPFPLPFSLRPGTADQVERATGLATGTLILSKWYCDKSLYLLDEVSASFDLVVVLAPFGSEAPAAPVASSITKGGDDPDFPLRRESLSPAEAARLILPHSNALRLPSGPDQVYSATGGATCMGLKHGSLRERMAAVANALPA